MKLPDKLRRKLDDLPDKPGCYMMRDRHGQIIYVGKAISLRKRVSHYFQPSTLRKADPKLRGLIRSVADLDIVVVRTEAAALLTEGQLIKQYRPRYNVRFRDDKRFLLLVTDMSQKFPRFELCRIQRDDNRLYFGPYASAAAAREALRFVEKRFGLRSCRPRVPGKHDYEHCIDDIIRFCTAPCIERIGEPAYKKRVNKAASFLRGEMPECLREIRADMKKASDAMDFEKAAALRDALFRLTEITRNRARVLSTPAMRREDAAAGVRELKTVLSLSKVPRIIEAYDISNISGTYSVASMVCSVDGLPNKSRYRRFRIKTVKGADDPASMAEVITRSFGRRQKEKKPLPDLVIVDGGIPQLRAALSSLSGLGLLRIPCAGLAKRFEEIFVADSNHPVRLPPESPALRVLQRLRDEAHRFALDYHRNLRSKRIRESALDDVPGIGPTRKQVLLKHFGSLRRLLKASKKQIAEVPGFGKELAAELHNALHSD